MKKNILVLLAVAMMPLGAYATIMENTTSDVDTLRLQGFSESALKMMDDVRYRNQGADGKYQKQFVKKDSNRLGRAYTKLRTYVDPIQEDDTFGEHQVNFSNTWNGDEPEYSNRRFDSSLKENL